MFVSWSVVCGIIIGAVIGSFLNMAIYRLPRGKSFVNPSKSFCPNCEHSLEAIDLIPLLSWLSTGGKCRYCKQPIASRYFYVELLTAALFAGIWWQFLVVGAAPLKAVFFSIETAALVAVIYIDWELFIIPDELNAFLLIVAIAYRAFDHSLLQGLYGGLLGWAILWGIAFLGRVAFGKDAMGHGDIKMMRGVGFLLGPALVAANTAIAVILGLVFGLLFIGIEMYRNRNKASESSAEEELPLPEPEPLGSLTKLGVVYLLALDVVAIPFPKFYELIGVKSELESEEIDDNWKPTLTTIPFGPYLAAGAIVCMLFAGPINTGIDVWLQGGAVVK